MSNHQDNPVSITVPEVITSEEGVTLYQVVVAVGPVVYRVKHRYSEFESMHSKIVEDGIEKDLLPPKKLIGNKDPAFIMKRRKDLETYLQTVYHFLEKSLPRVLAEFLDFPTYDIDNVLQDLARHYHETDQAKETVIHPNHHHHHCYYKVAREGKSPAGIHGHYLFRIYFHELTNIIKFYQMLLLYRSRLIFLGTTLG